MFYKIIIKFYNVKIKALKFTIRPSAQIYSRVFVQLYKVI